MPCGTSCKKQLSLARQAHLGNQATLAEDSDEDVDSLKSCLYKAEQKTQLLEQQLVDQVKVCTGLQDDLHASQDLVSMLCTGILSLKAKNKDTYYQLCMEHQHYKRATSKYGLVTSQIALLKKSDAVSSNHYQKH